VTGGRATLAATLRLHVHLTSSVRRSVPDLDLDSDIAPPAPRR